VFDGELGLKALSDWRTLVDVGLVAVIIYQLLLLLKGSRSGAVMLAVALLFGMFYLSQDAVFDLPTVNWLLDKFIGSIVLLLVVLFQDDIRRALATAVRSPLVFSSRDPESTAVLEEVLRSCAVLSQRGIGALIVIEQEAILDRYVEDGVKMDSAVSWQVLLALFIPSHMNPTHDGAAVIQKGRIAASACFLPLAYGDDIPPSLGSRHRAALGLADETDAIVVVVSEETGRCAVAHMGQLDLDLKPEDLRERFRVLFDERRERGERWQRRWRRRIVHHGSTHTARITQEHDRVTLSRITDQHDRQARSTAEHILDATRSTGEQRRADGGGHGPFDPTATQIPEASAEVTNLPRVVPHPATLRDDDNRPGDTAPSDGHDGQKEVS